MSGRSKPIRLAIAGVGNCASSLLQGLAYYTRSPGAGGLIFPRVGRYEVADIVPVAAFDVDARKVGRSLDEAAFALPNNARVFCGELLPEHRNVTVRMAEVLDGVAGHMAGYPESRRPVVSAERPVDVAAELTACGATVLVNYMPVGAQAATEMYARACLKAGVAFVNCMPVFIASDATWAGRFETAGLPVIGDDIKAQLGATVLHRTLARLFASRGVSLTSTYQLNTGGNTDFLNMLDGTRLAAKRESKTEAVQSQLPDRLAEDQIHIGPSDYIPFLKDNKVCFCRLEGEGFGGVGLHVELRLSVEDSPNSAACVVDAVRAAQVARDRGEAGAIRAPSAWLMKHPPEQLADTDAEQAFRAWLV